MKTEAAFASSLFESVIGAEKAADVVKSSASSDDLRTRTIKVNYIPYGTTSRPYAEQKFQTGSSMESLMEWLDDTRVQFKNIHFSNCPMQVEVISEIKGAPEENKMRFSLTGTLTENEKKKEPDTLRASAVSPKFKQASESLFTGLKSAEAEVDSDKPGNAR